MINKKRKINVKYIYRNKNEEISDCESEIKKIKNIGNFFQCFFILLSFLTIIIIPILFCIGIYYYGFWAIEFLIFFLSFEDYVEWSTNKKIKNIKKYIFYIKKGCFKYPH